MNTAQFISIFNSGGNPLGPFQERVEADGGTVEGLDNMLAKYDASASWQLIPSAVKAGTAYAQVPNTSVGDLTVTRASSGTFTNSAGVVQTAASNVLRTDYRNADGTLSATGRYLLEPQRTNVHLNSSSMWNMLAFNNGGAPVPTKVQSLTITSPTGGNDAVVVAGGSGSVGSWGIYQTIPTILNSGQQVTVSVFAKAGTNDLIYLSHANVSATGTRIAYFDLSNGTTPTTGATIEDWGNGWYRCIMPTVTLTANTSSSYNIGCYVVQSTSTINWSTDYTGKSVYLFGIQVETGAYPTTYIPTTTAAVTRIKDDAQKTGVSSIIGQSAGTIFWDVNDVTGTSTGTGNPDFAIRNTAFTNWIGITTAAFATPFRVDVRATSGTLFSYVANITRAKAAVAWTSAGAVLYVNGAQVATSAVNPNFSFDRIDMLGGIISYKTNQAALLPTRLTNAQLAELTTL